MYFSYIWGQLGFGKVALLILAGLFHVPGGQLAVSLSDLH